MFFISFFFSPFSSFEHVCFKNIIFNKIKGPPVILRKKNLWTVDSEMSFCKWKSIF